MVRRATIGKCREARNQASDCRVIKDIFVQIFVGRNSPVESVDVSVHSVGDLIRKHRLITTTTNLAIAVRLDPEFPKLVKEVVFMGALTKLPQPDFNIRFDPEAAHIVLTAPWPRITSVGDVTSGEETKAQAILSEEAIENLRAAKSPIPDYVLKYSQIDLDKSDNYPLWDELAAAVLIDPCVTAKSEEMYLDVDLDHGMDYGRVHVWSANVPQTNKRKVRVVDEINVDCFKAMFLKCMSAFPASP